MSKDLRRWLTSLSNASGAPGYEGAVRNLVAGALSRAELSCDGLGNLAARLPSDVEEPRVVITAHMDEVGFLVQHITQEGFLQFVPAGGWWAHTLLAQRVRVINGAGQEIPGVITALPFHYVTAEKRDQVVPLDQMHIDIGADSAREVTESLGIRLGDPIVPDVVCGPMAAGDRWLGKAFDNRVGVTVMTAAALELLAGAGTPNAVTAVGTVQEELGVRGAHVASRQVNPDVALVLEGPPADDGPEHDRTKAQGRLGGGVQIRVVDPHAMSNRPLVDFARTVAEDAGIAHQVAVRRFGGTDAKAFQYGGDGCPVVVLGVPCRYIHTHHAVLDMNDVTAAVDLVVAMVRRLDADTVQGFRAS